MKKVLFFILTSFVLNAQNEGINFHKGDFKSALAKAESENKCDDYKD